MPQSSPTGRETFMALCRQLTDSQLERFQTQTILKAGAFPERAWYRDALELIEAEIMRRNPEGLHAC